MKNAWEGAQALLSAPFIIFLLVLIAGAVIVTHFVDIRFHRARIVAEMSFHLSAVKDATEVMEEALVLAPKTWLEVRPSKDRNWIRVLVMDSPDAQKFLNSVQALSVAHGYPREDQ